MLGALTLLTACALDTGPPSLGFGDEQTTGTTEGTDASEDGATSAGQSETGDTSDGAGGGGDSPTTDEGESSTGDTSTGDTSTDTSQEPVCGNGTVEGDEECDDGNASNEDECLDTCVAATCGDGFVWEGVEVCDDGTNDGSYNGCHGDCMTLAYRCGDGAIDEAEGELCDDGNDEDLDGCTTSCDFSEGFKVVFVSGQVHSANFGGLGGADALCQALAEAESLPGTYMAWLSDAAASPASRFTQTSTPYILRDGTLVANGWGDLTDGTLLHAIDLTEQLGAPPTLDTTCAGVGVPTVWTNTAFSGASQGPSSNCEGWTTTDGVTISGRADTEAATWSTACTDLPCSANASLYCFQQ